MKLVTASQMRELDRLTIQDDGVPEQLLMERAGCGVADVVRMRYPHPCRVVCMVGKGNNGGDAQVAARLLERAGYRCTLCTSFDAAAFDAADVIIDGLLGTGARHPLSSELTDFITRISALRKPVIAIDIPSGLDATTGASCGAIVQATCTVTIACPKVGLYLSEGPDHAGEIVTVDIGISPQRVENAHITTALVTETDITPLLPARAMTAHKGDFGHVLVIAGSTGKMGAGVLAARGALRSGAGLVTYAVPEAAFQKLDTTLPEVMMESVPDGGKGHFTSKGLSKLDALMAGKSVIVLGPGIGTDAATVEVVHHILSTTSLPIVLDADALNCISAHRDLLDLLTSRCILTPHPGEMSRLTEKTSEEVQSHRLDLAQQFASAHSCTVVLKGSRTITTTGDFSWINPTGNPGMASAGMGDVLSGIVGGLAAQGLAPANAAMCAVFLHGLAGDCVAKQMGPQGFLASDVANAIPQAIESIVSGGVTMMTVLHPKV